MQIRGQQITWNYILGTVAAATLPVLSVLGDKGLGGASKLLAIAYAGVWVFAACRFAIHVYEGYLWLGLWRQSLVELAMLAGWGALAYLGLESQHPQIPLLFISGALGGALFVYCATELEEARKELNEKPGVRIRRGTDVVRESPLWKKICDRIARIDGDLVDQLRKWFARPDPVAGKLSRAASIAIFGLAAIVFAAVGLVIVGTLLGMPLTPETRSSVGDTQHDPARKKENDASAAGSEDGTEDVSRLEVEDCAATYDPGPQVPEPERSALARAWHEVDGVDPGPLEALSSDIAGCPGVPKPIPGKPGWWYRPGHCEGQLRAVAVAPLGMEHPKVMLEQAAEFALPLIRDGEFVDAVDRFPVGDGDAYVIDAADGSHVLFRDHNTAGPVEGEQPGSDKGGCASFVDQDVPYTIMEPELVSGWRTVAAIFPGGVYPIDSVHDTETVKSIHFRNPEGIVAEGRCWLAEDDCGVLIEGNWFKGEPGTGISRSEVEALVEG